jgi:glycosyltransferase involved in cell wall biosynthesis
MYTVVLLDDLNGVNYHRIMMPFERMIQYGYDKVYFVKDISELIDMNLELVSNVVIPRQLEIVQYHIFKKIMNDAKIRIIVDIDDYWILNKDNYAFKEFDAHVRPNIIQTVRIADVVWTPSEYLAKLIMNVNPKCKIEIVPNALNHHAEQWQQKKKKSKSLRFGFTGAGGHVKDLDVIGYTFESKKLYCTNAENYVSRLKASNPVAWTDMFNYGKVYENIDVSISPLRKNRFNMCKSDLKVVEAAFTDTAIIASNVTPYRESIIHGVTGILCSTHAQWRDAIESMTKEKAQELASNLKEAYYEKRNIDTVNEIRIKSLREHIKPQLH